MLNSLLIGAWVTVQEEQYKLGSKNNAGPRADFRTSNTTAVGASSLSTVDNIHQLSAYCINII
jgi:hypothetical protein